MYYEKATILPSEALVERFYSLAGFVYDNRRYNLDDRNVTCVTMKHLMWKLEKDDNNSRILCVVSV